MAIVSLLVLPSPGRLRDRVAFTFEHDQAHRRQNKNRVVPYVLDPMQNEGLPGTKWHLDHQLAHRAMVSAGPPDFGAILQDSNLLSPRQTRWWEFLNHQEHFLRQP